MKSSGLLNTPHIKNAKDKFFFNLPFWISACLVALISVAYTQLFRLCEEWSLSQASSVWIYATAPLGLLLSFLVGHFFSPSAQGSGIPQVIASIEAASDKNSSLLPKLLNIPMIPFKIFGSCLSILGGGASGREGPTLQISAAVFYQVSRFWPKQFPRAPLNSMILAGGAAGLASAFNTPLGGVVFAVEELSKSHISLVRTGVFQAVICAGVLAQIFLGNYLYLGESSFNHISYTILGYTVLFAALIGLAGGLFAEGLYKVTSWRKTKSFSIKLLATLLCGALLSLTIWLCGPQTVGAGKHVIIDLLNHPQDSGSLLLPVARIAGSFFTYVSGVIGGIFAPSLASGAALGHWLSHLFGVTQIKVMITIGMVAFLTGVTRSPFTSFVLVLEMSNSHEIILFLMLSSIIANVAARIVSTQSFYEKASHSWQS
ncbi:MAG: chloride channel protein [Bdellovibrio sp.]